MPSARPYPRTWSIVGVVASSLLAVGVRPGSTAAQEGAAARAETVVAATFFPWYDAPDEHFRDGARDLQRHHFVDPSIVHPDSVEWYERELDDAAEAGIDVLLVASVGASKSGKTWMPALKSALERRKARGPEARAVRVALLLDPWLVALERAQRAGTRAAKLDLEDAAQREELLAPIDRFFATFPPELRGSVEGAPLLVLASDGAVGKRPESFFEELERRAARAAGVPAWLVLERSWNRPERRQWRRGSGLLGPQRLGDVAGIGPGYDDRGLPRGEGVVRLRENVAYYEASWRQVLAAPPRLLLLESWNDLHDGTALCTTLEHGRAYVDATRRNVEALRAGRKPEPGPALRFDGPLLAESVVDGREHVVADEARFVPGGEGGGLSLAPIESGEPQAALAFARTADGASALRIEPRAGVPTRTRFQVAESFVDPVATNYEATIEAAPSVRSMSLLVPDGSGSDDSLRATPFEKVGGDGAVAQWRGVVPIRAGRELARGLLLESDGALELRSVALRRLDRRLPASGKGVTVPGLLDLEPAAVARQLELAAEVDASWVRIEVRASVDATRIEAAARAARDRGLEPVIALIEPPPELTPAGAHAREIAGRVARIAFEAPSLRFLELFPRSNVPESAAATADLAGHARVLREASRAAHSANPHLAIVAGAIEGADTEWLRQLGALREPFAYDALVLLANDEMGRLGRNTFGHELERFARELATGPDRGKPLLVEIGTTTAASPLLAPSRRALLPTLITTAWKQLEREPGPVAVLDEPELPLVRGLAPVNAVDLLEGAGLAVVRLDLAAAPEAIAAGAVRTLVLPNGEIAPAELLPALPAFVDRGGLLVTLGGAPFRRIASKQPDGGFLVDEDASLPLALRDDLRIALARARPIPAGAAAETWTPGRTAPDLANVLASGPFRRVLFTERTGQPRNDHGYHRYVPLVTARAGDAELGEVAALLAFHGAREGALLLIGVDAEDHGSTDEVQADALRAAFGQAESLGARAILWRGLATSAAGVDDGSALLRADGSTRRVGQAFVELDAAAGRGPQK